MKRKLITIIVDYDDEQIDHPSMWDWSTLLGDEDTAILRVEVYGCD